MRSFIISLILFVLLISTIFGNAVYVKNVSDHIVSDTEALLKNDYPPNLIQDLEKYWEKHRSFVGLSVGHQELDRISESIISLKASCESKNTSDARRYLLILQDAAKEMGGHEELSLENLF